MSTTEELLERKSSGSGLENRDYGRRDPSRWSRGTLFPQMLALTSTTSGGHSVGIVGSRTQATEFSFFLVLDIIIDFCRMFQLLQFKYRFLFAKSILLLTEIQF
jgi:hypothetical protein